MGLPCLGLGHRGTFRLFSFRFSLDQFRIDSCRLRHSGSPERDSSPTGSFPTEWLGSRQEHRAWVKHSRSIITLLFRQDCERTGTLSGYPESSDSDVSSVEAKAELSGSELRATLDTSPSTFLTRSRHSINPPQPPAILINAHRPL